MFSSSGPNWKNLHRQFGSYIRQSQTYWEAGTHINGSAAALPYYYSALNLAKAELLQTKPTEILGLKIGHGLTYKTTTTTSIKSDYLEVTSGLFPLLYEKRTGLKIPVGTRLPISNLLALIPEIGLEVNVIGRTRPNTNRGFHTLQGDSNQAWSNIAVPFDTFQNQREQMTRLFNREYEEVDITQWHDWRSFFAISNRMPLSLLKLYQSKNTHSMTLANGTVAPDFVTAGMQFEKLLRPYLSEPIAYPAEFMITQSIYKSKSLTIPLSLIRYAALFYLSSLVRYKPAAIDSLYEPEQAWLMDSMSREIPLNIIIGLLMGIRGGSVQFESVDYRI
ncbi:MAG: YaaC family protein [Candidatus Nanopelagicaceae bacterium]